MQCGKYPQSQLIERNNVQIAWDLPLIFDNKQEVETASQRETTFCPRDSTMQRLHPLIRPNPIFFCFHFVQSASVLDLQTWISHWECP